MAADPGRGRKQRGGLARNGFEVGSLGATGREGVLQLGHLALAEPANRMGEDPYDLRPEPGGNLGTPRPIGNRQPGSPPGCPSGRSHFALPRRELASSITSSWYSEPMCTSSTDTAPWTTLSTAPEPVAAAAASKAQVAAVYLLRLQGAQQPRSATGRGTLPPGAARLRPGQGFCRAREGTAAPRRSLQDDMSMTSVDCEANPSRCSRTVRVSNPYVLVREVGGQLAVLGWLPDDGEGCRYTGDSRSPEERVWMTCTASCAVATGRNGARPSLAAGSPTC